MRRTARSGTTIGRRSTASRAAKCGSSCARQWQSSGGVGARPGWLSETEKKVGIATERRRVDESRSETSGELADARLECEGRVEPTRLELRVAGRGWTLAWELPMGYAGRRTEGVVALEEGQGEGPQMDRDKMR